MRLAVIPARGGSKRIPRKNVRQFCGKPVIEYSIEAALQSGLFARVVVSTDDDEIAAYVESVGAEAPFRRPAHLSDDYTGTNPVVCHAVETLAGQGMRIDEVCCLYATAPFVTAEDLRAANGLLQPQVDFVFAGVRYDFPVQRALIRNTDGGIVPLYPEHIGARSQDLQETLHDAGQFYWGRPAAFAHYDVVFLANTSVYLLPSYRVQDIDTPEDWLRAERLYELWKEREHIPSCT